MDHIKYPSISICTRAEETGMFGMLKKKNISFGETKYLVMKNVIKRNESFFFVNQASNERIGFPCMSKGGNDPGKPCSFPFFWKKMHYNCTDMDLSLIHI